MRIMQKAGRMQIEIVSIDPSQKLIHGPQSVS